MFIYLDFYTFLDAVKLSEVKGLRGINENPYRYVSYPSDPFQKFIDCERGETAYTEISGKVITGNQFTHTFRRNDAENKRQSTRPLVCPGGYKYRLSYGS